jgi:carbon storage regulator
MLVLSRRRGQCVHIAGCIEIKVIDVGGGRVKLGFTAPPDVSIQRDDVRDAGQACPVAPETWEPCPAEMELCVS